MNTLSSLLNWIGQTIGADPNTLATTDKTLVGSINEVKSAITGEHNRIHIATVDPTSELGNDGDVWIKYAE